MECYRKRGWATHRLISVLPIIACSIDDDVEEDEERKQNKKKNKGGDIMELTFDKLGQNYTPYLG